MSLVKQRHHIRAGFERGEPCDVPVLEDYCRHRENNLWRVGLQTETLCEYILYLEARIGSQGSGPRQPGEG